MGGNNSGGRGGIRSKMPIHQLMKRTGLRDEQGRGPIRGGMQKGLHAVRVSHSLVINELRKVVLA